MRIAAAKEYNGPNIYSYYSVLKVELDLEDLEEIWSDQVPGFIDELLEKLPGLLKHYCSRGYEGGFAERLKEGTLFAHIVEHVALELQNMAGIKVCFGKTLSGKSNRFFEVIIETEVMEAALQSINSAVLIVEQILKKKECQVLEEVGKIKHAAAVFGYGPSTKVLIEECRKRDIPVMPLGKGSLLQLGYGKKQKRIQATLSGAASCVSVDIASDKDLTKKLLEESGIVVPRGYVINNESDLELALSRLGNKVVIKPCYGNQGKGVFVNLSNEKEIKKAYSLAKNHSKEIMVEEYISGRNYRLLVVNDKVIAAAERIPPCIRGDGVNTIKDLIDKINQDPLRGEGHEKPLTKIRIDEETIFTLAKQNKDLLSIPRKNELIYIRETANLSTGGNAIDVTSKVHVKNNLLAVRAARIIGLDIAGIDIISPDIALPLEQGGAIIEVNAAPGIRMHHYPAGGRKRNVAEKIIDYLFPGKDNGRIPIISVTGTNGKTTTTRLIGHILHLWGKKIGISSTEGIYKGKQCLIKGDMTGPTSAKSILREQDIEVAVLETARGGILRAGLGYDKANVGIITNISEDHLGLAGINDLEQMARVKSLVVERLEKGGTAVINADNKESIDVIKHIREKVILFSLQEENQYLKHHLAVGQQALFIKNGEIVFAEGENIQKVFPVKDMPISFQGRASFNIANALAATAACLAIGIPQNYIREGLRTFGLEKSHNPGRCQFYQVRGATVLLDYGHNSAAYENVLRLAEKIKTGRLLGVVGMPGDRRDRDIIKIGEICGKYLDYCIIKEDEDLRGRPPGKTAALIEKGLWASGFSSDCSEIICSEIAAVLTALSKCRQGDFLTVFYEKLEPLQSMLESMLNNEKQQSMDDQKMVLQKGLLKKAGG